VLVRQRGHDLGLSKTSADAIHMILARRKTLAIEKHDTVAVAERLAMNLASALCRPFDS
jgi:hypothetical protein